MVIKETT